MSVKASSWAWETSRSQGSAFLVLLALADHAGADGGDCYPSVGRLARRCRIDERTVQRAIDKLVELGEVIILPGADGTPNRGGRARPNRYRLTFVTGPQAGDDPGDTPTSTPPETPAICPETPASAPVKGGTTPPEPSLEPSGTPLTPTGSAAGDPPPLHHGQHANCRACGTNRRGVRPPDPELAAADARRRQLETNVEELRERLAAPDVLDVEAGKARAAQIRASLRGEDETGL